MKTRVLKWLFGHFDTMQPLLGERGGSSAARGVAVTLAVGCALVLAGICPRARAKGALGRP